MVEHRKMLAFPKPSREQFCLKRDLDARWYLAQNLSARHIDSGVDILFAESGLFLLESQYFSFVIHRYQSTIRPAIGGHDQNGQICARVLVIYRKRAQVSVSVAVTIHNQGRI